MQNLTAEDLRLLVNGCGNVDVHTLISYTLFNDESGKTGEWLFLSGYIVRLTVECLLPVAELYGALPLKYRRE